MAEYKNALEKFLKRMVYVLKIHIHRQKGISPVTVLGHRYNPVR
jgi:hypothetical protein